MSPLIVSMLVGGVVLCIIFTLIYYFSSTSGATTGKVNDTGNNVTSSIGAVNRPAATPVVYKDVDTGNIVSPSSIGKHYKEV